MLTIERLRELLDYDAKSGVFRWRVSSGRSSAGSIAGSKVTRYVQIKIDGHRCYAHRLAWFYMYGAWPSCQIDHIDCDPTNNRIANLRDATAVQNNANCGARKRNKSGFKGVHFAEENRSGKPWRAMIQIDGKSQHLGSFATPQAAHVAYQTAAASHFGEFARAV